MNPPITHPLTSYHPGSVWRSRLVREMLHLSADDRLLDAGSGDGRLIAEVASQVNCAVGIDASEEAVRFAKHLVQSSNVSFLKGDVTKLGQTLNENLFTKVICLEVLELVSEPEQALVSLAGCLEPGGILFLTVPLQGPGTYPLGPQGTVNILEQQGCHVDTLIEIDPPWWTLTSMRIIGLIRTLQGRRQGGEQLLEDTYAFTLVRKPSKAFTFYRRLIWPILKLMMNFDRKLYRTPGAMMVVVATKKALV